MTLLRLRQRAVALGAFICMLFTLCLWLPSVQADAEMAFNGVIKKISGDTVTVEVTEKMDSNYGAGEQIVLHLIEYTRIVVDDPIRLKPVSRDLLSSGSLVQITPIERSSFVEAGTILILKRRVK